MSEIPSPGAPIEVTLQDKPETAPYKRNTVDTDIEETVTPSGPSENIEVENNKSKEQLASELIDRVLTKQWEADQRTEELQRRYGNKRLNTPLMKAKMWLGGEKDYTYEDGKMQHNIKTEVLRRFANVAWKTAQTTGMALLVGSFTGGVGGVSYAAIGGATIARAASETVRGTASKEGRLREELMLARETYYERAYELAKIADSVSKENTENMAPDQIADHEARLHAAITDLVNYVYASEQHSVSIRQDENGIPFNKTNPLSQINNINIVPGEEPEEPIMPDSAEFRNPPGTEVYQPSKDAHSRHNLDDMEKEFNDYRNRCEKLEEGFALVGGLSAGIAAFLQAKAEAVAKMTSDLANGKIVSLDLDHNGIHHGVQKVSEALKDRIGLIKDFVFHYGSDTEKVAAMADGSTVIPQLGQHGVHALQESVSQILSAINSEATRQTISSAIPGLAALLSRFTWRAFGNENQAKHFEASTEAMKQEQEINRKKVLPQSREDELKELATETLKPYPQVGQEWIYREDDGNWTSIHITKITNERNDSKIEYKVFDKENNLWVIRLMSIAELLNKRDVDCVERVKPSSKDEGKKKEEAPAEVKASNPPASKENNPDSQKTEKKTSPEQLFDEEIEYTDKSGTAEKVAIMDGNIFCVNEQNKYKGYWEIKRENDKIFICRINYKKDTDKFEYIEKTKTEITSQAELQNWVNDSKAFWGFHNTEHWKKVWSRKGQKKDNPLKDLMI